MKLLICIDDTDNLESRGTGELAELMIGQIETAGWGRCSAITRHQLLVHDDIPYTSHNSSMCFHVELSDPACLDALMRQARHILETESAEGSDPGLAIAVLAPSARSERLVEFGHRAKQEVLTKEAAYALAVEQNVHLSEHGGTGQGVIGALAGIGLRMSGSDGRVKGRLNLGAPGAVLAVAELLAHPQIDAVQDLGGDPLPPGQHILLGDKVKTVWLDHQAVLLVYRGTDGRWKTCERQQLRTY